MIISYQQAYDDALHATEPFSPECMCALDAHVASFRAIASAIRRHWPARASLCVFAPDHGAHVDPATGRGTHGDDVPADTFHCSGVLPA